MSLITIGITCYREGDWLRECCESILAQDYDRWQWGFRWHLVRVRSRENQYCQTGKQLSQSCSVPMMEVLGALTEFSWNHSASKKLGVDYF